MVGVVYMLPVDLLGFWGLLELNIAGLLLLYLKSLSDFVFIQLLELYYDLFFFILGGAWKNDLLSNALILFLKLQLLLTVLLKVLFLVQQFLVQLLQFPKVLLSFFLSHEDLDRGNDIADLFLHAVEVLILGKESDLMRFIRLPHRILQKAFQFGPHSNLLWQIGDDDGVIRKWTGPLIIVIASLGDEIPDVEQHSEMDNEGEDAYQHFCIVEMAVDPWDVDHEAGAVDLPVLAGHVVLIQRPEELECVVTADGDH